MRSTFFAVGCITCVAAFLRPASSLAASDGVGGAAQSLANPANPQGNGNPPKPTKPVGPPAPPPTKLPPGTTPRDDRVDAGNGPKLPTTPSSRLGLVEDDRLLWGVAMSGATSVAAIHDAQRVYGAANSGEVSAWNLVDGNPVWTTKLANGFSARGVLAKNRWIGALKNGDVVSLDVTSGALKATGHPPGTITSALTLAGDKVLAVTATGLLLTLDPTTLATKIVYRAVPPGALLTPLVLDTTVIVSDSRGLVRRVDLTTGTEMWSTQILGAVQAPLVFAHGITTLALVGTVAGELVALDADSGDEVWRSHGYAAYVGATAREGDLLAVFANKRAFLIKSGSGGAAGDYTLRNVPSGPALLDGTDFLVPTQGGTIEVLDARLKARKPLALGVSLIDSGASDAPFILTTGAGDVYRWRSSP